MANSRKSAKKPAAVTQFPQPQTAAAVEDVPEDFQETAETPPPAPEPAPAAPSRNPLRKKEPRLPQEGDFFARVAAIPAKDWDSQRIYLYLYILEPLCNLKQSGGKAYLNRYSQPVRDEHQIAVEYGSGRYRLMLAYNKVSAEESTEVARYEFEIYNPQYPPKVPRAAWINDSRNGKWEALLPKEAPATASTGIVDAMRLVSDIRRDIRDEIGEPEPQQQSTSTADVLATMKAAKDLFAQPPAAPAPAKDPLEIAVALFQTMNQMKAENPVIDMYREELKAIREELKEARRVQPPAEKPFLEQLVELATQDKLEPIKKLFFGGGGSEAGRASRTTYLDVLRDLATGPAGATLAQGIGAFISNFGHAANPAAPGPYPTVLNAQQSNGTVPPVENPAARIQRIGAAITRPMIGAFMRGVEGADFARSMYDMQAEDYVFTRGLGAEQIVSMYRRAPEVWNAVQFRESDFVEFITQFCAWDPNEDEGPAPGNDGDGGVVDLEKEEEAGS